ncbi:cysteine repeat modular protein 1 [Plasmodium gonderi]|uniref:Cysteine repeat modular protein 1 n=1 Tax=Plasmodium gonderi TaxID=77519 RepID=A0A1Y1JEU8_PLAGO|nr:cysteine repeat modular protein 1 [Plasmodium gonderi]GAW80178.1 cysteine repeat modular protein 1 [Plasmodium gonderi]
MIVNRVCIIIIILSLYSSRWKSEKKEARVFDRNSEEEEGWKNEYILESGKWKTIGDKKLEFRDSSSMSPKWNKHKRWKKIGAISSSENLTTRESATEYAEGSNGADVADEANDAYEKSEHHDKVEKAIRDTPHALSFTQYRLKQIYADIRMYSALQVLMNQYCHPGVSRCAGTVSKCFCQDIWRLRHYIEGNNCVNNCGDMIRCSGPLFNNTKNPIPLGVVNSLRVKTCVVSSKQRKLDMLCGENKLLRIYGSTKYCIPHNLLNMDKIGNYCYSDKAKVIPCAGFFFDDNKNVYEFEFSNSIFFTLYNSCNEDLEGIGEHYIGCQNVSISGKNCLPWNSLNIKEILGTSYKHNYCRNPENLKTIYCFVNMNGFVFREYCEIKNPIIINNITYLNTTKFDFDITMKNASDFRLRLSRGNCEDTPYLYHDPIKNISYEMNNYTYHDVDGEVALTITFKNLVVDFYKNLEFSICACYKYYYEKSDTNACSNDNYKTKLGTFSIKRAVFNEKKNTFSVNDKEGLYIYINNEYVKNMEMFIINAKYSYQCNNLNFLEHFPQNDFYKLLTVDISRSIQRIKPSLNTDIAYIILYAYSDKIFDVYTMFHRNKDFAFSEIDLNIDTTKNVMGENSFINVKFENSTKKILDKISIQKIYNLKNGSNLICVRDLSSNFMPFSYMGKITYNDYSTSNIKYILKRGENIFENFVYLKDISKFNPNNHLFSLSKISCPFTTIVPIAESSLQIFKEKNMNRLTNYSNTFYYKYTKSSFKKGVQNHEFEEEEEEKKNSLYYFSIRKISNVIKPLNYLCERDEKLNTLRTLTLVNFSDFLFSPYEEFAHYFHVFTMPTYTHNIYLNDESYYFLSRHFQMKGIENDHHINMKILSIWSHEEENYLSLWFETSTHLIPFFLIKYNFHAPRFSFIEFMHIITNTNVGPSDRSTSTDTLKKSDINPTNSRNFQNSTRPSSNIYSYANFYIFSTKNSSMKKYITRDFNSFVLNIHVKNKIFEGVVSVEKFTHREQVFFVLLHGKNFIYLLDGNIKEVLVHNADMNIYIAMKPIKIQCLTKEIITCFILYEFHQILWFSIEFDDSSSIPKFSTDGGTMAINVDPSSSAYSQKSIDLKETELNTKMYKQVIRDSNIPMNKQIFEVSNLKSKKISVYIMYKYAYIEKDLGIISSISKDMVVISKLSEYVIYISSIESNKLRVYSTDVTENTIVYYKYVRNEHMSNYRINSIFAYSYGDMNFINSFMVKANELKYAIFSFMHEKLSLTKIIYKKKISYVLQKLIQIAPIIEGDKRQIKYFTLSVLDKSLNGQYIVINKKTGVISMKLNKIEKTSVTLKVIMHGLFHATESSILIYILCASGYFYSKKKCFPCPKGTYNNVDEIKGNPEMFTSCIPCEKNKTTLVNSSKSKEHCICDIGHEYIKNPKNPHEFICSPCKFGEYKDTISNELCKGNGCIPHSRSHVLGAKSEAESICSCNAGYFLSFDSNGSSICKKCLHDHYCPGNLLNIQMCPKHNETLRNDKAEFITMDSCFCKKGYEPISIEKVKQKGSRDEHYYNLFFNTYSYAPNKIDPKHICMECNIGYYKDSVSSESCKKCPYKSMNKTFGNITVESCNSCYSGFYKDVNKDCSICLANHFCVGSFPPGELSQYIGDAVVCPNNSITKEPYEHNDSYDKCLCVQGYVKHSQESYNLNEHCKLAPLNFYKDTISNNLGIPCPPNSITLEKGAKSIHECICKKGFYYSKKIGGCKECPTGYYCPQKNMKNKFRMPIKCPRNSSSVKRGSYDITNCQCNFGYTPNMLMSKSRNDQFSVRNKKSNKNNINSSGTYSSFVHFENMDTTKCNSFIYMFSKNPINHVQERIQQSKTNKKKGNPLLLCTKCPISTYKSSIANEACFECPKHSTTLRKFNNSNIYFCQCNEGYYLDEQICKPCSFNKLYCQGEKIFQVSQELYDEMLGIIKRYVWSFAIPYRKHFINSVIYNHSMRFLPPAQGDERRTKTQNGGEVLVVDTKQEDEMEEEQEKKGLGKKKKRRRLPVKSYFGHVLPPVMLFSSMSKIGDKSGTFFLQRYEARGLENGKINNRNMNNNVNRNMGKKKKKNKNVNAKDKLINKLLKNFFYTDSENVSYVKYQQFVKCQKNTVIPLGVDSARDYKDCKCAKGHYLEFEDVKKSIKICNPCKEGTFKNFVGDETSCVSCPPKSTSLEGSIYPNHCFCKEGFFYSMANCLACLEGARCNGGLRKNVMSTIHLGLENIHITEEDHVKPESIKGYYLDESMTRYVDVREWKFIKCPIHGACLERNKCHYSMNNYLCVECAKGYTNDFKKSLCVKCPNNAINIIILLCIYIIFCFIIILISYLNISSGFYRRSIHSIVIKISVNYISSMLLVNILEEKNLLLPQFVHQLYNCITRLINIGESRKIISIDCLLRYYFNLSYADSFFYSSLLFFFIPILLMTTLTIILFVILKVYTFIRKTAIANKLDLLSIARREKIHFLTSSLEKSYSKERFIMILRYIKLQHYTWIDRTLIFFEDMIPVYVTFLFMIHGKTSVRMFQLFDCSYIKYTKHFGKYILSRVSSVECELKTDYLKFFILGLSGTIVWSLGIPLLSFFVLYINRCNLFQEKILIKYGFLHNGYLPNRWYWEIIVFVRKIFFLFITTVVLFPSEETNTSKLLLITFVAIFSLCVHFIFQPFDKRNFFMLNKLENMSLYIWVSTIVVISILLSINLNDFLNFIILSSLILLHVMFSVKLLFCLFYECVDNMRRKKAFYHVPVISNFTKNLIELVQRRKIQEPLIYYDKTDRQISIMLPDSVIKKKKKSQHFAHSIKRIFKHFLRCLKKKRGQKGNKYDRYHHKGREERKDEMSDQSHSRSYNGAYAQVKSTQGDDSNDDANGKKQGVTRRHVTKRRPACRVKNDMQYYFLNVQKKKKKKKKDNIGDGNICDDDMRDDDMRDDDMRDDDMRDDDMRDDDMRDGDMSDGDMSDGDMRDGDKNFCGENFMKSQKMNFCFFLKSNNESTCTSINKEYRMFAIEIYEELLDIFMTNVTLTHISYVFFEFIFKITINIGNLIDNLDQKDQMFVSMDQEQNFNNIIQWSLERKEKYNENKKLEKSKICNFKNCKYDNTLLDLDVESLNISSSICEEEEGIGSNQNIWNMMAQGHGDPSDEIFKKSNLSGKSPKIQVSKKEREKLFTFFSDDLLNRKINLSEFYFILIELKLKYCKNLPSYFYMFMLYKKLEKQKERQELRKLNRKLKECQRVRDKGKVKSTSQNLERNQLKEKTALLYKEYKDLCKMMIQLKEKYINLSKNDLEKCSSKEYTVANLDDNEISLSSGSSMEDILHSMGFDQSGRPSDQDEKEEYGLGKNGTY